MACTPEFTQVVLGEDRDIALRIVGADHTNYDLTGVAEITALFKKADLTLLQKKFTLTQIDVVDAINGRILIHLLQADTALLRVGDRQDFTLVIDKAGKRRKVNYLRALSVARPVT